MQRYFKNSLEILSESGDRKKYLHVDQMIKCLRRKSERLNKTRKNPTLMSTSRLHRTIPMLPPLI
jgi:hypothetical protein